MKKLFLFISLLLVSVANLQAQESVRFGAKAGVNFTNMNVDNSNNHSRTGFHIGLLAEVPLTPVFSVQPEALYATQGADVESFMLGGPPITVVFKLDYIQVPVLAKFYLLKALSIEAGPSFNFLISEEVDGRESELGSDFEFGGALGASYKFTEGFFGSIRYTRGFTNALDLLDSRRNNGFQLGIGYMF